MHKLTRREFCETSAKVTGLAAGALTLLIGLPIPVLSRGEESVTGDWIGSVNEVQDTKILVAYASRCGSTQGIAEHMGSVLRGKGLQADVQDMTNPGDLSEYSAAVLGSAVRSSQWLPEAMDFVDNNYRKLSTMPVAYFFTCLTLCNPTRDAHKQASSYLEPVTRDFSQIKPVTTGLFAGALDYEALPWPMRFVMRRKMEDKGISEGDYRNWEHIGAWSSSLGERFFMETGSHRAHSGCALARQHAG